ncbi:hypothetical protein LCGC14_0718000 [marine sediment metagenome]|uniref:Uncharacterized protein n=1 Tax=marine sediment metagenome TaxID=412755 RepID=A0A0F9QD93_9ZZZZ
MLYFHKDLYLESLYFNKEIQHFSFKRDIHCDGNVINVDTNLSLMIFQKMVLNAQDAEIMTVPLV